MGIPAMWHTPGIHNEVRRVGFASEHPGRALRIFQVVATIVLVLSFGLPFRLDQPLEGQLSLVAMHTLVGAVIIATMTWVATKPTEEVEASETGGQESRGTD